MSDRKFWLSLHTAEPVDGDLHELDVRGYERQEIEFGEVDAAGLMYSLAAVLFPEQIDPSQEVITHLGISDKRERGGMLLTSGTLSPNVALSNYVDRWLPPVTVKVAAGCSVEAVILGLAPRPAGTEAAAMELVRAWMRDLGMPCDDIHSLDGLLWRIRDEGAEAGAYVD